MLLQGVGGGEVGEARIQKLGDVMARACGNRAGL